MKFDLKNAGLLKSRKFKIISYAIGTLIVGLVCFALGMEVGLHKAKFSGDFSRNYERNFMGRFEGREGDHPPFGNQRGPFGDFEGRGFRNAHGISGKIISIADNNLVVQDRDSQENTISVTDKTLIKYNGSDLKLSDLKIDDEIVVVGSPGDNGTVNADLIRVFNNARN